MYYLTLIFPKRGSWDSYWLEIFLQLKLTVSVNVSNFGNSKYILWMYRRVTSRVDGFSDSF